MEVILSGRSGSEATIGTKIRLRPMAMFAVSCRTCTPIR